MRNVGLLANNDFANSYLEFLINGLIPNKVIILKDANDILKLDNPIIIATAEGNRIADAVKVKQKDNIEVDLIGVFQNKCSITKGLTNYTDAFFPIMGNATGLLRTIERMLKKDSTARKTYVDFPFSLLNAFTSYPYDLYLKINEDKRVKCFSKGDCIDFEHLKKFQVADGLLEIRFDDFFNFISKFKMNEEEGYKVDSEMTFNLVHKSATAIVKDLGLNDETVELADNVIKTSINKISKNESLLNFFYKELKKESYKSDHSMVIPYLATAMCQHSNYKSDMNIEKMVMASFFHDITLDDHLAEIDDLVSYEFDNLDRNEKEQVERHMFESVKILRMLDGVPEDVEKIILQHHEKHDGTGFPRGLDTTTISPLACIFIVAHEFIHCCYEEKTEIDQILNVFSAKYTTGKFAKALASLIKALGRG